MDRINYFMLIGYLPLAALFLVLVQSHEWYEIAILYSIFYIIARCWYSYLMQFSKWVPIFLYMILSVIFGGSLYAIMDTSQVTAFVGTLSFYVLTFVHTSKVFEWK